MSNEFNNKKIIKFALTAASTGAVVSATGISLTANTFTKATHGLKTGDVTSWTTSNTLPTLSTGIMTVDTAYYVIKVDDNTFKLATSYTNAIAETNVDVTGVGVGTQTFRENGIGEVHTGIIIPDNAMVTSLITNALTAFTSTGGGGSTKISVGFAGITPISTVAFDHATLTGIDQWITTTPLYTTSEAELIITVATNALAGGVYDLWIEYNI
ncbi:hypothetical protein CCP3SC1AL1_310004 [Gammaproteobacteria bacterium]